MGKRVVERDRNFISALKHIKDKDLKIRIWKQVQKIVENPEVGKPMRFGRKGTRELYVSPFRLSYEYVQDENKIILLDLYHKDEQ